ncbi:MAG TPA: hypothetical protein VNZ61_11640 [Roseomonas sp.]|nr:hypothetical protein [Roseomonas sp.]
MVKDNTDITPPRPPGGEAPAKAPAGAAGERQKQLRPEAPPPQPPPAAPGVLPPQPEPPQPENPPAGNPHPKPMPHDANKKLPQTQYGTSGPVGPGGEGGNRT